MDKKHSLLIVDDEHDIVESFCRYFRDKYTVHKAYDGDEAFKLFNENEVHLVITDQRMPKMQGTDLLASLREKKPEITRILMMTDADIEVAADAINKGSVHRYLPKPLNFEELEIIVKEGLELYQEASKLKNLIARQKEDVIGKVKNIFSKVKNVEMEKGKLVEEVQAARKEKASAMGEIRDMKEKLAKMEEGLEQARAEAGKVKQASEEKMKIEEELKDLEAKFSLANKSASSLKSEVKKIEQERDTALAEKNRMDKKLKQFQANWAKVAGR